MNRLKLLLFLFLGILHVNGQDASVEEALKSKKNIEFKYEALILPTALIGFGAFGRESHTLKQINTSIKNKIGKNADSKLTIDDFAQYSPFLSVYGLNTVGIEGRNNFKDRTIILGTAYLMMGGTVKLLKHTCNVERPDGSSKNSFPSGHTATAFMGAEFLYQEYKDVSIWYGISGYLVASGTGYCRIYNNKHWATDVAAGAGIGILSTKIAYWIHPVIKRTFFKNTKYADGMVMPFYNGRDYGLGISMTF